ncbi:MAG: NAD(P)-binding domain-containing protein [Ignavibacteria bacterium]|nr:NAD(P)-binding domain-containing protein [Ignavibacteria bacterium]
MNIAILGTGMVGATVGKKLTDLGHKVMMGSRTSGNEKALEWVKKCGANASAGKFSEAAAFGEIIFLCTNGAVTIEVIGLSGKENFNGKTVIDITNPLDFSKGMPPTLIPGLSNTNSLGEEVQKTLPDAKVVKTLNTVNCEIMIAPDKLSEETSIYISGNEAAAKEKVTEILRSFGWTSIIDLGDISTARGTEMMLPLWIRLWGALKTGHFNFKLVK